MDQGLYTSGKDFTVDSAKSAGGGKADRSADPHQICAFPSHRHNFIEVLYVCEGSLINIIGGKQVVIEAGELLFLNQFTRHEIPACGQKNDFAEFEIFMIIFPETFFDVAYTMAGSNNVLAEFSC